VGRPGPLLVNATSEVAIGTLGGWGIATPLAQQSDKP